MKFNSNKNTLFVNINSPPFKTVNGKRIKSSKKFKTKNKRELFNEQTLYKWTSSKLRIIIILEKIKFTLFFLLKFNKGLQIKKIMLI